MAKRDAAKEYAVKLDANEKKLKQVRRDAMRDDAARRGAMRCDTMRCGAERGTASVTSGCPLLIR